MIAAIWWWSTRRSGRAQAPGNAELRESTVVPLQSFPGSDGRERDHRESRESPDHPEPAEFHERRIAPLEPLSIRTGEFDRVPVLDLPMMVEEPTVPAEDLQPVVAQSPPPRAAPPPPSPAPNASPGDRPAPEPPPANVSEQQKIITVRVCAVGDSRWPGKSLIAALEGQGLAYGRYQVYHRRHADGRSIFFVASLIEPGTFDPARMVEEEYRGVSMFAVLPGPLEPLQAIDALLATARELARELTGTVQDAKGMPFSPQRVAALREDVARFQSVLNS